MSFSKFTGRCRSAPSTVTGTRASPCGPAIVIVACPSPTATTSPWPLTVQTLGSEETKPVPILPSPRRPSARWQSTSKVQRASAPVNLSDGGSTESVAAGPLRASDGLGTAAAARPDEKPMTQAVTTTAALVMCRRDPSMRGWHSAVVLTIRFPRPPHHTLPIAPDSRTQSPGLPPRGRERENRKQEPAPASCGSKFSTC